MKNRLLCINCGSEGSSWSVSSRILCYLQKKGFDVAIVVPNGPSKKINDFKIFTFNHCRRYSHFLNVIDGADGFRNYINTKKILKIIEDFCPDIVLINTIHGSFLNIKKIINYLDRLNIPIVVTMHDSWWMTGRCTHFLYGDCKKYIDGCKKCKNKGIYPRTILIDKSKKISNLKKSLFNNKNVYFVAVSNWLATCARKSFILQKSNIFSIYNGFVSTDFYKIQNKKQEKKHKKTILAVSANWSINKGLNTVQFIDKKLDYEKYDFIIVGGGNFEISKKAIRITEKLNPKQLNWLYNDADVFINPSRAESLSSVNIESQMAGCDVVAFNIASNCETVANKKNLVNPFDNKDFFEKTIKVASEEKQPIDQSFYDNFSEQKFLEAYYNLFISILKNKRKKSIYGK